MKRKPLPGTLSDAFKTAGYSRYELQEQLDCSPEMFHQLAQQSSLGIVHGTDLRGSACDLVGQFGIPALHLSRLLREVRRRLQTDCLPHPARVHKRGGLAEMERAPQAENFADHDTEWRRT